MKNSSMEPKKPWNPKFCVNPRFSHMMPPRPKKQRRVLRTTGSSFFFARLRGNLLQDDPLEARRRPEIIRNSIFEIFKKHVKNSSKFSNFETLGNWCKKPLDASFPILLVVLWCLLDLRNSILKDFWLEPNRYLPCPKVLFAICLFETTPVEVL